MSPVLLVVAIATSALLLLGMLVLVATCWRPAASGQALVINRLQHEPRVSRSGAVVLPIVHRAEVLDLSVRALVLDRRGKEGVICADGLRADMKVTFLVRVNDTTEDILRVARTIGCARAADPATLEELFGAKFAEAVKTVAARLEFEQLYLQRDVFKDTVLQVIGQDLNGYVLDDAAVDYLEQTPLEALDRNNVLDARGIEKILAGSAGIDALERRQRARTTGAGAAAAPEPGLRDELAKLGLRDVRVATEVSCDVALGRPSLSLTLDGTSSDAAARLPASLPRAVITAAGPGELTCSGGRATFRWTQTHVSPAQLVAGARLVHALRDDDHAYR